MPKARRSGSIGSRDAPGSAATPGTGSSSPRSRSRTSSSRTDPHGSQEGCRLLPQRARFGSEVPGREAVRRGIRDRGEHPREAAGNEVPPRPQRAPRLGRHAVYGDRRAGQVRAQEQEAVSRERVPGGGEELGGKDGRDGRGGRVRTLPPLFVPSFPSVPPQYVGGSLR